MADENRTILALVAIALVITVIGTVVSVSKLDGLGGQYTRLTGAVVDTGTTSVTIAGTAAFAVDVPSVSFGSGYVTEGSASATLDSSVADCSTWTGWTNTTACPAMSARAMLLNNTGTVPLSVAVDTDKVSAEAWLCEAGSCTSVSSQLRLKVQNNEAASCTANGALLSDGNYVTILTNAAESGQTLCTEWDYNSGSDSLTVFYEATVPNDAATGAHTVTVTFTAVDSTV